VFGRVKASEGHTGAIGELFKPGLDFDGHLSYVVVDDFKWLRFLQVELEDGWNSPIEAPSILNGQQAVFSRNDVAEQE
jgi:hypothetical protein